MKYLRFLRCLLFKMTGCNFCTLRKIYRSLRAGTDTLTGLKSNIFFHACAMNYHFAGNTRSSAGIYAVSRRKRAKFHDGTLEAEGNLL